MAKMRATLDIILTYVSDIDKLVIDMQEIKTGVQGLQRNIDAEYTEKLLAWLSPLEPQKRHQDIKATRIENTGNWILHSSQFQSWVKGETSDRSGEVLGCYGEPAG
ncbi:hypothetical protein BDZ91DRAFT_740044 [Kalaharituber pfeilii]|nr:hypothetical protein BDZ91DRAFT_740044 [Kalaharituber pfeilii]